MQWPKALQCLQLPPRRATEAVHLPSADVPTAPERLQVSVQQAPVRQARRSPALPMQMRCGAEAGVSTGGGTSMIGAGGCVLRSGAATGGGATGGGRNGRRSRTATRPEASRRRRDAEAARPGAARPGRMRPGARAQPTLVQPARGQGVARVVQRAEEAYR